MASVQARLAVLTWCAFVLMTVDATFSILKEQSRLNYSLQSISVYYNEETHALDIERGLDPTATAVGSFMESMQQMGWDVLELAAESKGYSDTEKAYALGVAESVLTLDQIYSYW